MSRILELRKPEIVVIEPGPIYDGLNQDDILSKFTHYYPSLPKMLTAVYIRAEKNPVDLPTHTVIFREIIKREATIGPGKMIWNGQVCLQLKAGIDLDKIIPSVDSRSVYIEDLVHAVAHLALPYTQRCRNPWIEIEDETLKDFDFQELVYRNMNKPEEAIIVFNFPTKVEDLGKFIGIILDYIDRWANGEETTDFKEQMKAYHKYSNAQRKK